jgi:hypothetical protein
VIALSSFIKSSVNASSVYETDKFYNEDDITLVSNISYSHFISARAAQTLLKANVKTTFQHSRDITESEECTLFFI